MNFMALLKSLDDLLFEIMSWIAFYPITLWRSLRHPLRMMEYADVELGDKKAQQYTDTLRPPLFLLITLFLSHGIELALVGASPLVADTRGLANLVSDDTSLVMLRLFLFSLFPMVMAVRLVRQQGVGLTRDTLRPPFYSQCYVAAPFALVVGFASTLSQCHWAWAPIVAVILATGALLWYGLLQSRWFAIHLGSSNVRGFGNASIGMIESLAAAAIVMPFF